MVYYEVFLPMVLDMHILLKVFKDINVHFVGKQLHHFKVNLLILGLELEPNHDMVNSLILNPYSCCVRKDNLTTKSLSLNL